MASLKSTVADLTVLGSTRLAVATSLALPPFSLLHLVFELRLLQLVLFHGFLLPLGLPLPAQL